MDKIIWTESDKESLYTLFVHEIDCLTAEANHYLCNKQSILSTMYIYHKGLSELTNLVGYYPDLTRYVSMYLRRIRLPFIKGVISNTIYEDKVIDKISNDILNLRKYILKKYGK